MAAKKISTRKPPKPDSGFNSHGIPNYYGQEMLNAPRKPFKPKKSTSRA